MKNTDKFIIALLLLFGIWMVFSEPKSNENKISPDELYQRVVQYDRYFSTDKVAQMIISKDPSLQLIDVRSADEYNKFTLEGATNIPLKDILKTDNLSYFDQDVYNTVLFSNGSSDAIAAWMLVTRLGYKNVYVLKGGLNKWVETILKPKPDNTPWDVKKDELYQFRKGASQYFGGGTALPTDDSAPKKKKTIVKRKKKEVTGGCG